MHHRMRALAATALLAGAVSAGCGDASEDTASNAAPTRVDDAQVEQGIEDELSTSSAKVTSATCPGDVAVEEGDTFTCTVGFDNGGTGKATVTQQGPGRYAYELEAGSVQVPGSTADAAVETSLAAQGIPGATVRCPQTIIVEVGTTVTCDVSGGQGVASGTVTFTFSDAAGTVDAASVEA